MRVEGLGFRVQGSGCRVQVSGFRVQGSGCTVQGFGVRDQGLGMQGTPPSSSARLSRTHTSRLFRESNRYSRAAGRPQGGLSHTLNLARSLAHALSSSLPPSLSSGLHQERLAGSRLRLKRGRATAPQTTAGAFSRLGFRACPPLEVCLSGPRPSVNVL